MKTKTFLLICLLLGIGLTQLSAQNGKDGTGTNKYDLTLYNWFLPVYCEGVLVDEMFLESLVVHVSEYYIKGNLTRETHHVDNVMATSVNTDEVFKSVAAFDHISFTKGYFNFHGNLVGNKGNNYSFNIKYDTETWTIVEIHSNCH